MPPSPRDRQGLALASGDWRLGLACGFCAKRPIIWAWGGRSRQAVGTAPVPGSGGLRAHPQKPSASAEPGAGGELPRATGRAQELSAVPPLPPRYLQDGTAPQPCNLLFLLHLMAAERQGDRGKNMRRDFPNPHFLSRQHKNSWGLNIWEI